ncbi:MAG: gliding motility-associated C-terminal domain-containing protein, partial [Saprospiraceae bacterium]|nr:gliding motility-associated C-terminal domain-containing protein [Saprospiraceae bacterium]
SVAGGTAPFNLNWTDGASGAQRSGLAAGQYAVLIEDAKGCALADTFNIEQLSAVAITGATVHNADCHGAATGSIGLTAGSGLAPYAFQWSNGATGSTLDGLPAGDYAVTLSDALGCTASAQYAVGEPLPLLATTFIQNDTCGQHTGSIDLGPAGGTPPWSVLWSTGAVSEDLLDLPAGDYSATLTDAKGCVFTAALSVAAVEIAPVFEVFSEKITCSQPLASAVATPANLAYQWQSPTGELLNGAVQALSAPGQYTVVATNAQGCTATLSLLVEADLEAPLAELAADQIALPCDGSPALLDGSLSTGGSGVSLVWSYLENGVWTADTAAASILVAQPGLYRLAVTDLDNGCAAYDTVWVIASEGIDALWLGADSVSCHGRSDGRIRVDSVWGGNPPFEYALAGQAFSGNPVFDGLPAGGYTVTVRDMAGCTANASIGIGQPAPLSLGLSASASQITAGATVDLLAEIEPAGQLLSGIQWLPEGLFPDQNRLAQTLLLNESTLIEVRIETEKGCADTASIRIEVLPSGFYIPNAIAPGRPGNDGFTAFGGPNLTEISLLSVFDRWGNQIFERRNFPPNNPALGWDGRFRGRELPAGVYVYHVELRFANGDGKVIKGEVVIWW